MPLARTPADRLTTALPAVTGLWLVCAAVAVAHPLGNDTITHFSVLYLFGDRVEIDHYLDVAEGPAVAWFEHIDTNRDTVEDPDECRTFQLARAEQHRRRLRLRIDGEPVALRLKMRPSAGPAVEPTPQVGMFFKPGDMKPFRTITLMARFWAPLPARPEPTCRIDYEDPTYSDVPGVRRILVVPHESVALLDRNVRTESEDPHAWDYARYDRGEPVTETAAFVVFRVRTDAATSESAPFDLAGRIDRAWRTLGGPGRRPEQVRQVNRIAALLGGRLGGWGWALLVALCFGYGAWHALMPGHAKTLVAAYLISQHGRLVHAVVLGLVVTATHVATVVVLGLVMLPLGAAGIAQLALGAVSGAVIAAMGLWLLWRGLRRPTPHPHSHADAHDHHDHDHRPPPPGPAGRVTARQIVAMGFTGGLVPCPAAVFILFGAASVGRVGAGLIAVGAFSLGLAVTLTVIGVAALASRRVADRLTRGRRRTPRAAAGWLVRLLPILSGAAVTLVGSAIAGHYASLLLTGRGLFGWLG